MKTLDYSQSYKELPQNELLILDSLMMSVVFFFSIKLMNFLFVVSCMTD